MSYCRFAWEGSDVYVFESDRGIECCGCRFDKDFVTSMPEEMISHLAEHRRARHFVPPYVIGDLWNEIPGAARPANPEPPGMTWARIFDDKCRLERALEEAEKRKEAVK